MKPRTSSLLALAVVLLLGPAALAQDARNMSLLGNFGMGEGDSKAVFGAGSLAFYGLGNKVQIASFSTPSAPVKISSVILGDVVESLVRTSIGGTQYIVACGGSKLWLINVQSPAAPVLTSTTEVAPGTTCEGVATSGSYAYIAAGASGLKIYSIATPAAPSLVASIDSLAYCESVVVSPPYAYIAADGPGYVGRSFIFDVSTPSAPVYKSTILGYGGYHQYIAVRGVYAYICDYNSGLQVINVSVVTNPVNVVMIPSGFRTASIVFDGNYGYVAVGELGLFVYDVTNPAAPNYLTSILTGGRAAFLSYGAITVGGSPKGHIYVSNRDTPGLAAVDVSTPGSPAVSGTLSASPAASGSAFSSFYLDGKVYVAYGTAGLRILDVANPGQPALLSSVPLGGESRGVVAAGGYAYVAAMDSGVHVVDATNPASPVRVTTLNTSRARGIAINGNTVYVATRDSGLVILDASVPASPVWIATVRGLDLETAAASGTAAGASEWSTIRFFDVTNPGSPVEQGSTPPLSTGNEGFAISGGNAYVTDGDSLKIFSLGDLLAPVLVSKIKFGGYGFTAAVVGDYCYVAAEGAGVRAINVSNPAVPVEDGYYDGVPQSRGLSASGEYVYVAEKADGLSVYRNDLLTSIDEDGTTPLSFALAQNYPNPFNPSTKIVFSLPVVGQTEAHGAGVKDVKLAVFDLLGRQVAILVNERKGPGDYEVTFNAGGLSSGMYVYRLQAGEVSLSRTMMVLK